jgi:hypothetical protein
VKIIPKQGQWFRLRNSHWDSVFLSGEMVPTMGTKLNLEGVYLQVKICKFDCRPIPTYIPLWNNSFDIITDPEEEALLAIAYGSDPAG